MKNELLYRLGAAIFALASFVLAFVFKDWLIALVAILSLCTPLSMLIMTECKFKPYEWFLYAAGVFSSIILLLMDAYSLLIPLPLSAIIITLIIIRINPTKHIVRLLLMLFMQCVLGFLFAITVETHALSVKIDNAPYQEQTISSIKQYSQTYSLIKFESSDDTYHISQSQAELLKAGDKVSVKVVDNNIYELQRL